MMKKIIIVLTCNLFICSVFAAADADIVPVVDLSSDAKPISVPAISTSGLDTNQRINKLEQQINNINEQNLISKIDELQQRTQKLTGQVEELNAQLRSVYQDLSQQHATEKAEKVEKAEKPVTEVITEEDVVAPTAKTKKDSEPGTDKAFLKEQQMYQTAIDLLPDKKYAASGNKLRDYLKNYPNGVYIANAHYWLGEINFLQKNYDAAEEEFKLVVDKYSKSKRVSDAMFKLALVHQNQGRDAQAKKELRQVTNKYPGTSAAQLAKSQLEGN